MPETTTRPLEHRPVHHDVNMLPVCRIAYLHNIVTTLASVDETECDGCVVLTDAIHAVTTSRVMC